MNQQNLPNFVEPQPTIVNAVRSLAATKIAAPAYLQVVRQITKSIMTLRPGRVIIAAVPNPLVGDWLSESVADYYTQETLRAGSSGTMAIVDLPNVLREKERERSILRAYVGMPMSLVRHNYNPQFNLELGIPQSSSSTALQVYSVVTSQTADCYIVRNAEKIADGSSGLRNEFERISFFTDLAKATGKTHVLVTAAAAAVDWLSDSQLANTVQQFWIKPYPKTGVLFDEFVGILAGFDLRIPRVPGFSLTDYATKIHAAVGGCPTCTKQWIEAVLSNALGERESLSWDDFIDASPTELMSEKAVKEATKIENATFQPLRAERDANQARASRDVGKGCEKKPKQKNKTRKRAVGQRSLGRDRVAQPGENAA